MIAPFVLSFVLAQHSIAILCVCMYVMLCYVMLCYVMLCYVMLCYVMLCMYVFSSSDSVLVSAGMHQGVPFAAGGPCGSRACRCGRRFLTQQSGFRVGSKVRPEGLG